VVTVGKLKFKVTNKFLRMLLPSGRTLSWYQPTIESREVPWGGTKPAVIVWQVNPMTKRYERKALIGSSAFQSSVQGTARDLLIHGVSSLQRAGYDVVLRVHDEVLALVREGEGDENEFGNLLCQQPAWAQDLPLAFEAWRGKRFRK
jgi:DNA polymerase